MQIINRKPKFGYAGPYCATSFKAFADLNRAFLVKVAKMEFLKDFESMVEVGADSLFVRMSPQEIVDSYCAKVVDEFISGLEIWDGTLCCPVCGSTSACLEWCDTYMKFELKFLVDGPKIN